MPPALFLAWTLLYSPARAQETPPSAPSTAEPTPEAVRVRPKRAPRDEGSSGGGGLLQPDVDLIDAPTSAVLDYGGYSSRTRFYSRGGVLEYLSFGVFQRLNLGASMAVDGIVGNSRDVRVRTPNVQVKWRFYEGDRDFPSFALGFDNQGYLYNQDDKRYNQRQRGFYVVASQELGLPGFMIHPSVNISDFDTNAFGGSIPLSYNIQDKVMPMFEWDNINNFSDSRINTGLRFFVTRRFHLDFALRGIGQGGFYGDNSSRGPERIVQLKYSGNF